MCEFERDNRNGKRKGEKESDAERSRNRQSVCELMAGLRWVRLISQGVVANRRGARPTMTILECYYTKIRTLTFVYTSEHTLKLCSVLIYHYLQLFFFSSPLLSSPQLVASVSFYTRLERNSCTDP